MMKYLSVFICLSIVALFSSAQFLSHDRVLGDEHWDIAFDSSNCPNGPVYAIAVNDTDIYVGGQFTEVGGVSANNIARWDGHQWWPLGDGVNSGGIMPCVYSIAVGIDYVYAGGFFYSAGSVVAHNIARWNGVQWDSLSSGALETVRALTIDGEGNLFAGGDFNGIGPLSNCGFVAMWDGLQWNPLDSGMSGQGWSTKVNALVAVGTEVYAGGYFSFAGGDTANNIAVWNGSDWAACNTGTNGEVFALSYRYPYVYVGGSFNNAGGVLVSNVTKYIAGGFMDIAGGIDTPPLAVSYGTADLFTASSISYIPAENISKFDCCWDPLGSGVNGTVRALAADGNSVWVGGDFSVAGGKQSVHFGRWNPDEEYIGIQEKGSFYGSVYPNPSNGLLNLRLDENIDIVATLQIFNAAGMLLFFEEIGIENGKAQINLGNLPTGLYHYRLLANEQQYRGSWIKL